MLYVLQNQKDLKHYLVENGPRNIFIVRRSSAISPEILESRWKLPRICFA